MQGPREMTQLFEELSKSFELRDDYERLKQEMLAAETNAQVNLTRKKDIVLEMREAKQEQMDAKRFQNLKQDLVKFIFCGVFWITTCQSANGTGISCLILQVPVPNSCV